VMITCHDLGRHLGCHGASVASPRLDALARSGALFRNAFTTSPGCSPARGALATGRYPHSIGLLGLAHPPYSWDLHPQEQPIAALLGKNGYRTHLFGLQHISPRVERLGFGRVHIDTGRTPGTTVAEQVEATLATDVDTPFYLEVNLEEAHRPYDRGDSEPADGSRSQPEADAGDSHRVEVPPYLPDTEESRAEMAAVGRVIARADGAVGRILDALDGAGFRTQTAVVFTSDHGLAMPRAKCTLYDPGLEVTLMVRLPGATGRPPSQIDGLVSTVSVMPTLCEIAGVAVPETVHGRSLVPLLRGGEGGDSEIFAEKTFHTYYDPMRAIRTTRHKLIRNFETTPAVEIPTDIRRSPIVQANPGRFGRGLHPEVELYDLEEDPFETTNLGDSEAHAALRRELDERLLGWMVATGDPLFDGVPPSPRTRRALARS
jgi:N-sulfoglucosamine sulfohydrolase